MLKCQRQLSDSSGFHVNGCAVAEDLGNARGDFRGVVANADNGVGAEGPGVSEHEVKRVLTGALTQARIERNVAAEDTLDARAKVADDRARADNNAAHDTERFGDAI